MNEKGKVLLLTSAGERAEASRWGFPLGHMAYVCGKGTHLYRRSAGALPTGGYMVIGEDGYEDGGDALAFCREVLRECQARGYRGIVVDFEGEPSATKGKILRVLEEQCVGRNWDFLVPECYGNYVKKGKILISSALSGGRLGTRLDEVVEKYGASRICLSLDPVCEEFTLPAPRGSGVPLSREEWEERKRKWDPSVFFSEDLCAYYFTYMSRDGGAHFVLYDDGGSLVKKMRLGEERGISHFAMVYGQCKEMLGGMF